MKVIVIKASDRFRNTRIHLPGATSARSRRARGHTGDVALVTFLNRQAG
jgi:hypothetical protein